MKSSKFILSTLIAAAAMTSTAWAEDLTVNAGDMDSTIYVNSAWSGKQEGEIVGDGHIYGSNAFAAATGAFSFGAAEIIVESDINELLLTDCEFIINKDTTISSSVDGEARLVNFYNNGTSYDIVIGGDHSNSVREKLTIDKNVTLKVADRLIWIGYYGNDVDVVVDGTLSGYQLWVGADTTVSATGKLVAASEAFVLRRGAVVTLNGNAAQGAAAADRTASLEASYTSLLAGEIIANNTLIESGKIGANNSGHTGEGSIHVELNNTIWNSTGNLQLGSGVLFEVNNGSILNVTLHDGSQASSIGATSSLWIADSTVNASTMNVSGEIDVYNGKLNIASGKALTINEGGKVFVRGASDVKAAVDGAGWLYIEDAELDSDTVITGETANVRVVSGSSTVSGSELNVNAFQVGVGKGEDDLLDTLTGSTITFKDNAKLSVDGDTYDGWVGSQYAKRNEITDARYVLNVENSMMNAGYLHISTDGILNVSGHTSDDNKYVDSGHKVDFYAGDFIINGVANFSGTDAFIRYLKVSVDNTGTAAPGTVNITDGANVLAMVPDGANNSQESFIIYNNGIVNVDNATFTVDDKTNIAAGGKLNAANGANVTLEGNATNNGTINVAGSSFKADTIDNAGSFTVTGNSTINATLASGDYRVENAVLNGSITNNGKVYVVGDTETTLKSNIAGAGKLYVGYDNVTGADKIGTVLNISGDREITADLVYVDDGATLNIAEGNSLKFIGNNSYDFRLVGGDLNVAGSLTVDNGDVQFSRSENSVIAGTMNVDGQTCIYGSKVTVDGLLNITHGENMGDTLIIGYFDPASIGGIDPTANLVVNGTVTVNGGDMAADAQIKIYTDEQSRVGTLTVNAGGTFETDGTITNSGVIKVDGGTLSAETVTNTGTITVSEGSSFTVGTLVNSGTLTIEGQNELPADKVELSGGASVSVGTESSVTLTVAAGTIAAGKTVTVSEVAILEDVVDITVEIDGVAKNVEVLAAWSFVVDLNGAEYVTVEMDVGFSADELRILHKGNKESDAWEDVTGKIGEIKYEDGKVSFNAKSFSSYAAVNVPEPSAFGLLAGLGALALVAARRRRRK